MSELDRYGITHAKYGFMPCGDQRFIDRDVLFAGAFHHGWERVYAQENYIRDDYVVERCLLSEKPFSFEEVNRRLESGEFVGKRRQMHSLSRDFNIRNGVAIPLPGQFSSEQRRCRWLEQTSCPTRNSGITCPLSVKICV